MIVKLKGTISDYPDLSPAEQYFVIGIEADDFRILNDAEAILYPSHLFEIVDSREPTVWITEYGDDGERYSYPPTLREPGFFEDYFDGRVKLFRSSRHAIKQGSIGCGLKKGILGTHY